MQKLVDTLKAFWHSLPQPVQALLAFFASAVLASLGKHFQDPAACWSFVCLKQYVGVALGAGFSGVIGLYMRPGPGPAGKVSANVSANDSAAAK